MTMFQLAWPQLDISLCSYQSYLVIALILFCLAAPFFTALSELFCLAYENTLATLDQGIVL